ncbi:hypothetical protein BHE74_00048314 [Ensete ventricosum]|nr:hypothetical protein GW17_00027978 [Ensete ventricosum]RWW45812.1 hypothetical protein BHE74_00048314 [Ensete ventricosum]RZS23075.1 hypothetical protein BHM03_00055940 [Ensete ventricosum]
MLNSFIETGCRREASPFTSKYSVCGQLIEVVGRKPLLQETKIHVRRRHRRATGRPPSEAQRGGWGDTCGNELDVGRTHMGCIRATFSWTTDNTNLCHLRSPQVTSDSMGSEPKGIGLRLEIASSGKGLDLCQRTGHMGRGSEDPPVYFTQSAVNSPYLTSSAPTNTPRDGSGVVVAQRRSAIIPSDPVTLHPIHIVAAVPTPTRRRRRKRKRGRKSPMICRLPSHAAAIPVKQMGRRRTRMMPACVVLLEGDGGAAAAFPCPASMRSVSLCGDAHMERRRTQPVSSCVGVPNTASLTHHIQP